MKKLIAAAVTLAIALSGILIAMNGCVGDRGMDKPEELEPVEINGAAQLDFEVQLYGAGGHA